MVWPASTGRYEAQHDAANQRNGGRRHSRHPRSAILASAFLGAPLPRAAWPSTRGRRARVEKLDTPRTSRTPPFHTHTQHQQSMGETDDPPLSRSVTSKTTALRLGRKKDDTQPVLPTHHQPSTKSNGGTTPDSSLTEKPSRDAGTENGDANHVARKKSPTLPAPAASSDGEATPAVEKAPMATRMKHGIFRFGNHTKRAILHSWVNVLLIFVPIGIAVYAADLDPVIVFSMNAIAIIPLAGLLAHATEAVAARLGDTLGALLNVSFGNAVELILFIILLAANQIEVVQAALLGSILANLLLILGMAFLLGGLRYQEQVSFSVEFAQPDPMLTYLGLQ